MDTQEDEARSEAKFQFKVKEFSKLKDKLLSGPRYLRNLPWKIKVVHRIIPSHARQPQRFLAFFLQCNGESESTSWSCYAKAELRLLSVRDGQEPYTRKTEHLFNSKEIDWGYPQFIAWNDVLNPEEGYIKDDTITLEVWVLANAPHGLPWDSKKHTGNVGLNKQGATSYMNSLFQDKDNPKACAICFHQYNVTDRQKRVRSLGCGHSMCTSCLLSMYQQWQRSITCPQCRYVHQAVSVDSIPINFGMESLINSSKQTLSTSASSNSTPIINGGLCENHATIKLFNCDTCKVFICVHCTVLEHPRGDQHKIINIKEALSNKKSCNVVNIECEMKNLQEVKNTFTDRVKILEKAKATHNNVLSEIQKTIAEIDAQHKVQLQLMQEAQQKITQLSVCKQQVISTESLEELAAAEKNCSTSLSEIKNWIKVNKKDSKEFSQLQKRSYKVNPEMVTCHGYETRTSSKNHISLPCFDPAVNKSC